MRILFMGTPDFAEHMLSGLIEAGYRIDAVFTQADRRKNRGMKLLPPPVKATALRHGIAVFQPETLRDEDFYRQIEQLASDVIVVAAYGKLLPQRVLKAPRFGCINVHASLLPKYRGASPINAAILHGERESGVTIMQMERGLDTGDMLYVKSLALREDETFGSLHDRLMALGREALLEALPLLKAGSLTPRRQDDSLASYAPLIKPGDAAVRFFEMDCAQVDRHIRAYDPVPGAYGLLGGQKIKLFEPCILAGDWPQPGRIIGCDAGGVSVACARGAVRIACVQGGGGKKMAAADFFRGRAALLESAFE